MSYNPYKSVPDVLIDHIRRLPRKDVLPVVNLFNRQGYRVLECSLGNNTGDPMSLIFEANDDSIKAVTKRFTEFTSSGSTPYHDQLKVALDESSSGVIYEIKRAGKDVKYTSGNVKKGTKTIHIYAKKGPFGKAFNPVLRTLSPGIGSKTALGMKSKSIIASVFTSPLLGFLVGATAGYMGVRLGGSVVDKIWAGAKKAESVREHMRSLDFGGTLSAGYYTQSAATERQRADQALSMSDKGGRRNLGKEADLYAATL